MSITLRIVNTDSLTTKERKTLNGLSIAKIFRKVLKYKNTKIAIAYDGDIIIGWTGLIRNYSGCHYVLSVYVRKSYRGKRIGTTLVDFFIKEVAADKGINCLPRLEYPAGEKLFKKIKKLNKDKEIEIW